MTPVSLEVEVGPAGSAPARPWGFVLPVALLWVADKLVTALVAALHIRFPTPLALAAAITTALVLLERRHPRAVAAIEQFFQPGVDWVHAWLPLWYMPALVTLPLAVRPLTGVVLAKASALVVLGLPLVLFFTAAVALLVRRAVHTEMEAFPYRAAQLLLSWRHWAAWGALAAVSLLATALLPPRAAPLAAFPFLLAVTVLGYMAGLALPRPVQQVVHPIAWSGAAPNAGAALVGALTGAGYWATLEGYVTKGQGGGGPGPGDALFSFLGVVILSFAFKVYEQWPVMRRHAAEIVAATASSALFSLVTTAGMARAAGLPPDVARGLVPRSVTIALALPIADQLGAPPSITAAAVCLTGFAGGLSVQGLLSAVRCRDPIARGLAAAASAHGFGTAALSAKEPEALPFCALSYAMTGVSASVLAALPPVRALLLAITG